MLPEEKRSSTFLGRTDHLAETDSSSLVDERAARFEDTSENSIKNVFIERDERSAPELAFPYFDASIWEPESGLEAEIEDDISPSSSSVDDAEAIMDYPNVSSTLACHWDVAFEPTEDDATDDETSQLRDAAGKFTSHLLVPQQLSPYQNKAAIKFEEHARACFSCKDPLEVFRRHGKLCVDGFCLAKRLLAFISRSNGRVYGEDLTRLSSRERRVLKKKPSSVESWIDTSDPPVKHKPAKSELKKSVFGNYMGRVLQRSRYGE
ncbi:unnamed protein product [Alternaria sp. RS040]